MKNRALFAVALMIVFLSVLFFYNMIAYSKREIQHVSHIYANLIQQYFTASQEQAEILTRRLSDRLLQDTRLQIARTTGNPEVLPEQTREILKTSGPSPAGLKQINWYLPGRISGLSVFGQDPSQIIQPNALVTRTLRQKIFASGIVSGPNGLTFHIVLPFNVPGKTPAVGALEFLLDPQQFLAGIEKMLGLQTRIAVRFSSPPPSGWRPLGARFYAQECATPCPWLPTLKTNPINPTQKTLEISLSGKTLLRYDGLTIPDYRGEPAAIILATLDITDFKEEINSSLSLLVPIAICILIVVFMTLYYSFGRLLGRLMTRDKQLEAINTQLETRISERESMELELKTHRDHLEELIAEGTMELEIKSQEIEANEMKLRTVTSSIQDAIFMVDPNGQILFWNTAAERMFGYSNEELPHKNFFIHIIPLGSYQKFVETFGQSDISGNQENYSRIFEIECTRKNRTIFPVELVISEVEIQDEPNLIALLRDITRKKEEETQNRILLRAVEQSSVAIQIADTNGIIQYVNPRFTQITGYEKDEVIGRKTSILKSNFNPQEDYKHLWETISAGKDWNGELYNRRKDGELYWDSTLISPIKDQQGRITHFVAVKEDITERKNMEVELMTAKEAAEAASRSKGEFLANMSHEIRTPMNAIMGMTELALGTPLNEEQREYLEIVSQASRSLLKLLNDILDFSKVDAGKLILESKPFELRKSLGDIIKTLAIQAHSKKLELIYYICNEVPDHLIGDVGRMRQVIVNLIGNAIKFTDEGEIVLKIDVLEDGIDNKVLLHFVISDTGIGIPEDQLGFIFEKFAQADSSSTRKYGGTGLGLAISAKLVELMGGVTWAESPATFPHSKVHGPGSTFHFTALFELADSHPNREEKARIALLKGISLLIVDDNETNRRFLKELLARDGLKPETAGSGQEALALLADKKNSFQLLILDFRMPEMDGGTLLKKIRRDLGLTIPVILITSGVKPEDLVEFKSYQADAHLLKPVNSSELLEVMLRVLGYKTPNTTPDKLNVLEEGVLPPDFPKLNVLVAEDNIINQRLIRRLLEKEGHQVDIAADGNEAVELFIKQLEGTAQPYDLILMDIQMPNMDGLQATSKIRQMDQKIPVIALTAHAMKGDKGKFIDQGMDDYVSKPIDKKILFETIERCIPRGTGRRIP